MAGTGKAKKLFPLLATSKFDNGAERYRFEVRSVTPEKITGGDEQLFQPPTNYFEIQPLPFWTTMKTSRQFLAGLMLISAFSLQLQPCWRKAVSRRPVRPRRR